MVAVNVTDTCSRVHFPAMGRFRRFNWSLFCSSSLNLPNLHCCRSKTVPFVPLPPRRDVPREKPSCEKFKTTGIWAL